jgi:transposase
VARATFVAAGWEAEVGQLLGEFHNRPEGWEQFARQVEGTTGGSEVTIHLVLVPTGGYELGLALFLVQRGWRVSRPNPRHVRDWAKGLGQRAKTDRQDALLLARYAAERRPPRWAPLPAAVSELESLLERQRELEAQLGEEQRRKQALAGRPGIAAPVADSLERMITALEGALQEIQAAIDGHLKAQPELKQAEKRLRQVPGVGARNALPLLVLLWRWRVLTDGQGKAKGLVAFAGLDPVTFSSGTSVRGRGTISRQGDRRLRSLLYMGALGGVRGHNALRAFYQSLVARGKAKKLALVAAARKILVWSWAVFRDHADFASPMAVSGSVTAA